MIRKFAVVLIAMLYAAALHAATTLPKPKNIVTDGAGILTNEEVASLTSDLQALRTRGLGQVLIYIVPALPPGETMEEVTLRSANAWGVGDRMRDDGVVIFVFMSDRKIRIELGLGVEKKIDDATAARIIQEKMVPAFKRSAYAAGLHDAVVEIGRRLSAP
ncbi:MAG TPA: TPM domain-containing protein [Thermoanaerobaculia bacterium]|nr:TPM domain-containing protein [Thermoanaerobaculia bacterium]